MNIVSTLLRPCTRRLDSIHEELSDLRVAVLKNLLQSPPEPDPFVCVLIEANGPEHDHPTTLGGGGRVAKAGTVVEIRPHFPLTNVRVTVFCDVERVVVQCIVLGVNYAHAAIGECPIARFESWPLGVILRVQCGRRS